LMRLSRCSPERWMMRRLSRSSPLRLSRRSST
jgi:hypothetical protein